jgi:hypothetical protein
LYYPTFAFAFIQQQPVAAEGEMKIIDKINDKLKRGESFWSCEFFPPRTEEVGTGGQWGRAGGHGRSRPRNCSRRPRIAPPTAGAMPSSRFLD